MLCDAVIASKFIPAQFTGWSAMREKIRGAQKFVLAPDFTAASEGLVDNYLELERVLPFCRLPYPLCWFEWAQGDRPEFFNAPLGIGCKRVSRVGFLCEQQEGRASLWKQHMFWTFLEEKGENSSVGACLFDTEKDVAATLAKKVGFQGEETAKGPASALISRSVCPIPPEIWNVALVSLPKEQLDTVARHMLMEDWRGEVRFTIAMLGLLNARNVSETETVDKTEHNRKRAKKQQPPLCSHKLLKIRPKLKPALIHSRNWKQRQEDIRAHFVIGHWKARRTGLFFWHAHMRGSLARGYVGKDYELTR